MTLRSTGNRSKISNRAPQRTSFAILTQSTEDRASSQDIVTDTGAWDEFLQLPGTLATELCRSSFASYLVLAACMQVCRAVELQLTLGNSARIPGLKVSLGALPMRSVVKIVASLAMTVMLWPIPPVYAQNLRDPHFMAEAQAGFSQIFNLDYDQATATFSRLRSEYPRHPAPAFYMAVALWLRELFGRFSRSMTLKDHSARPKSLSSGPTGARDEPRRPSRLSKMLRCRRRQKDHLPHLR